MGATNVEGIRFKKLGGTYKGPSLKKKVEDDVPLAIEGISDPDTRVRWEDPTVYAASFNRIDMVVGSAERNSGGMPMHYDGMVAGVEDRDVHTLIFGSTGSKKTRLCILPTLYSLAITGESFITTDPKGELYDRLAGTLRERGYEIVVLNFRDPTTGNCWNPLELPYSYYQDPDTTDKGREMMLDLSANLIEVSDDPYWSLGARNLLSGLMEMTFRNAASREEVNMRSVCKLKSESFQGDLSMIRTYVRNVRDISFPEYSNLCGVANLEADTTRSCFLSLFDQNMQIFSSNDSLSQMLARTDFDPGSIGFKKTAVFLLVPDEKDTYNKLVSMFVKQIYEKLIHEAGRTDTNSLPVRVNYVLDEFGNIPTIEGFSSMMSAARSRNIRFFLAVQTLDQITSKYGKDAETIRSNCNNIVYLYSNDLPTLKRMSALSGDKEDGKPLVTISMLQHLDKTKGEAYVMCGERRLYPYVTTLKDIDELLPPTGRREPIPKGRRPSIRTVDADCLYKRRFDMRF